MNAAICEPKFFINKYLVPSIRKDPVFGPERKPIFINIPFTGDQNLSFVKRSIKSVLSVFPAAEPIVFCNTRRIPVSSPSDQRPISAQINVIYSFVCNCGSRYIGRTGRSLGARVREHVPKWLLDGHNRPPRSGALPQSAIARHLIANGCDVTNVKDRFRILYKSRSSFILRLIESLSIRRFLPDLCVQKEYVTALLLPW